MKHVVDAHSLVWFIEGNSRLGPNARGVLEDPNAELIVPAIALAEACWVVERGRTGIPSVAALLAALDRDSRASLFPLDRAVIERSYDLQGLEMHDGQIVTTALVLADRGETVAVLTRDPEIVASGLVPIVW